MGTFDLANYGDLLLPEITERELIERIPDVQIRRLAPYGWEHPVPIDGGTLAEPLGAPTVQRRLEIAQQSDAVMIGGGEIIHFHDELLAPHYDTTAADVCARAPSSWFVDGVGPELRRPTAWNAVGIPFDIPDAHVAITRDAVNRQTYIAVRDTTSCERLEKIGVDQQIHVVPDPGFIAPRVLPSDLLARRRRLHIALGWIPPSAYIVVHGNGSMVDGAGRMSMALDAVLGARPDLSIVLLHTGIGHGDVEFTTAFRAAHPSPVWMPTAPLLPIDVASIIAGAHTFVGVSMHGAITAMAYGKRAVVFNAPRQSKLRGLIEHLGDRVGYAEAADELPAALRWAITALGPDPRLDVITREIDAHFDRLASMIEAAHAARGDAGAGVDGTRRVARLSDELAAARRAHAVRGRRLLAERDALGSLLDDRDHRIAELEAELAHARHVHAELEAQLLNARLLEAELDAVRAHAANVQTELDALHSTKTMRVLRGPRRVYGWLRR